MADYAEAMAKLKKLETLTVDMELEAKAPKPEPPTDAARAMYLLANIAHTLACISPGVLEAETEEEMNKAYETEVLDIANIFTKREGQQ